MDENERRPSELAKASLIKVGLACLLIVGSLLTILISLW